MIEAKKHTIELSIVIVSYNARAFLNLCLHTVQKATVGIQHELFVVDNASADGTVEMIQQNFPDVILIANSKNQGFSAANNQAIAMARGQYIVLLNPDTLIGEHTFQTIINFYKTHPQTGGIGFKMIDGSGRYLRESKRGLPTPYSSFCKLFGLTRLFPESRRFAQYYHGHLDPNSQHPVDILPGAFLAFQKKHINPANALDDTFFMYGEDIDFSYRLKRNTNGNIYLGNCTLVHFKGESTPLKAHMVYHFYKSMWLFYRIHFHNQYSHFTRWLVYTGINLATAISLFTLPIRKLKNKANNTRPIQYHNVLFCTKQHSSLTKQLSLHFKDCDHFKNISSIDELNNQCNVLRPHTLLIFDLNSWETSKIIQTMEELNEVNFAFLSPDYSFLLSSPSSTGKGQIMQLNLPTFA